MTVRKYLVSHGWTLEEGRRLKIWLNNDKNVILQGPFIEGTDFRLLESYESRPISKNATCIGRDAEGRLLWLIKEGCYWIMKSALDDEPTREGYVNFEILVPRLYLDEILWIDVPGFPRHQAHPEGEVRIKKTKKIMKCENRTYEYRVGTIDKKNIPIHRIIAQTFIPNPNNLPQVNHKNGNKRDNRVCNLEWVTASQNVLHAYKSGLNYSSGPAMPVKITMKDGTFIVYASAKEASKAMNIHKAIISQCLTRTNGIHRSRGGKTWDWKVERCGVEPTEYEEKSVEIEGFTHLIARTDGQVFNKKLRKPVGIKTKNYLRVAGSIIDGKRPSTSIHRIIAQTFIPNPEQKPYVNHKDGDTLNNAVTNLEWCTSQENAIHARKTGLHTEESLKISSDKKKVPVYQLELNGVIIRRFATVSLVRENMGIDPSPVCTSYSEQKLATRHQSGGYGWCYVSDYISPKPNKIYCDLFPELVSQKNINFDILRPFIIRRSRPVWQIDIGGNKINLWASAYDMGKDSVAGIWTSIKSNFTRAHLGYFWSFASYEEIINSISLKDCEIPQLTKNALKIPAIEGLRLKKSVIKLLYENKSQQSNSFFIKKRPLYQLSYENQIVKIWPGAVKVSTELGYDKRRINHACNVNGKSYGYIWRHMKLQEMCDNVPKEYWE